MAQTPAGVDSNRIQAYRQNGFVHIPGLISREEALRFREVAIAASERLTPLTSAPVFTQNVNVWTQDDEMARLTLHPRLAAAAELLAGVRLRLWHDQILIKKPHNNAATEFHQDQPYWPHADSQNPISAWIALGDVPVEMGCMTFIPGSQRHVDLPAQDLLDSKSLFEACPELVWEPRVTVPLRAGDCTFHHGRCAHMATPNLTDEPRVAHVVIFMDAQTTFNGAGHVVTDSLGLKTGDALDGTLFPLAC